MPNETTAILDQPLMTPEIQRAKQRDQDIELLKAVRQATLDIRAQCHRYDTSLAYAFAEPLQKVEEALAWLLLARELGS
jgi:hypothetical protein